MEERLQNVLSHAGVASRRKSAELIAAGRVTVDGVVVKEPGERVDPATAKISVDGKPLAAAEPKRTVMLYKPVGVLSSTSDPFGGKTVAELVTTPERLVPVGRLDKDSEGMLLMSNDGDLTLRLTHSGLPTRATNTRKHTLFVPPVAGARKSCASFVGQ